MHHTPNQANGKHQVKRSSWNGRRRGFSPFLVERPSGRASTVCWPTLGPVIALFGPEGQHSPCRGRQAPVTDARLAKPQRGDTIPLARPSSIAPPGLSLFYLLRTGALRHRLGLYRPSGPIPLHHPFHRNITPWPGGPTQPLPGSSGPGHRCATRQAPAGRHKTARATIFDVVQFCVVWYLSMRWVASGVPPAQRPITRAWSLLCGPSPSRP